MYYAIAALSMFIFPIGSVLAERFAAPGPPDLLVLIGKWYAFWAVGVRLFLAGMRQSTRPEYTARHIFEFKSDEPLLVIQELGFANLSIGLVGIVSVFQHAWILPAALAGGLFYGLAGIKHVTRKGRNRIENVAMCSDLYASFVLFVFVFGTILR